MSSKEAGSILLELIISVAIIVVIISIVVLPLAKWLDAIRLQLSGRELVSVLRLLHNRALVEERRYSIVFIGNNEIGWGYEVRRANDDGILKKEYQKWFSTGVRITFFTNLIFHPTGAPSEGATIRLANLSGSEVKITVLPATGRVKIFEGEAN